MAGLAVAAGLLVALPTTGLSAVAAHDPWKLKEVRVDGTPVDSAYGKCEACHTMDDTEGEPGTSYISATARTLQWIKLYKGGGPFVLADNLGCTFCHSSMLDNIYMEDALQEFDSPTIKHPMGRKIDGTTNTNNEWLSTINSSTAVNDELQCISCHTTALVTYPYHQGRTTDGAPWTGTWDKTVNPYGLQNVTVAGDGDKKHCVDTCHGNAVVGGNSPVKPLMGHYAYGNFNGTTLYDPAGQAMQVAGSVCVTCHDTHSSTKPGLIQDGLKRGAADPGRTAVNEANCVAVCHASGAFNTHGHGGKVGISSTACTPCHVSSIRHRDQTDDATRRRLGYSDTVMSSLTRNLGANGLDDDMDGVKDGADPDEATFAYSKTSNCKTCHINYQGHGVGASAASCLDCHDMHGDSAAVNNNAAMIRSSIMGENTVFTAADRAAGNLLFDANTNAVCDNDSCHSNISGGLATAHLGGAITQGTNCAGCHALGNHPTSTTPADDSFKVSMNCAACHSYPPVTGDALQTGIVKVVDHTIRTRDGVAGSSTDANFLAAHGGCSLCHGVSGNGTLDNFANAVTATGGKDAYTGHMNGSVNVNGISGTDNNANANYSATNGQCARACHSPGWVVGYATLPQTVYATGNAVWLQEYGSGSCNGCHGNTVSGAYWPDGSANSIPAANNAGRHPRHMTVLAARLGYTLPGTDAQQKQMCEYCHQAVTNDGDHAVEANLPAEVFVGAYRKSLWGAADADATYRNAAAAAPNDVCQNTDCHASRQTTDGTYGWYDAGTVGTTGCAMCHDVAPATGKHAAHLASNALPNATSQDECFACHDGTMDTATAPDTPLAYGTANLHVNGVNNVAFDALYDYEAAGGTGTAGSALTTTCSDIKCHNGVTTPTWGAASINCGQCHNTGGTGPLPSAASVVGKHAQHANNDAVYDDCLQCHASANSYTSTGGHANHQNLAVNVSIAVATYADTVNTAGGVNYAAAGATHVDDGTCTFTSGCHGTGAPAWGAAATLANGCFACHTGTETGQSKPAGAANSSPNPVVLTGQYDTYGHGRPTASGNYPGTTNPPANYLYNGATDNCYSCHSSAAVHSPTAPAADPYRLGAFATNTNGLCDTCHGSGGSATNIDIVSHTKTITGSTKNWPATPDYDYKCVDCHDPHGDLNYAMVRSYLSAPTASTDTSFGSNSYGTPADTAAASAVTFTSTAGYAAGSYGISGTGNGICEVCHTQTAYFQRGVAAAQTHNTSARCTTCHDHKAGLAASCTGCHGNTVSGAYWPDDSANSIPTANNAGRHPRHITVLAARLGYTLPGTDAQQKQMCEYCHQAVSNDADHGNAANLPAEVFVGAYRKSLWGAADADATYRNTAAAAPNDVCQNTDCHASRQTTDGTYGWYDAGTVGTTGCAMCHDVAPATGKHAAHLASNALPNATSQDECFACHDGTMDTATTPDTPLAYSAANLHVNGVNNVAFDALYDYEAAGGTGTAGSALTTTCSDIKCHNGVTTPTWGALTINCGQCHNTGGTGPLPSAASVVGKHPQHANNDAVFDDCLQCHASANSYSATGGHANHQNLTVNVSIAVATYADTVNTAGGVNYAAAGATHVDDGTCTFTSGCHGTGAPGWGTAATLANGCFACHTGTENGQSKPAGAANSSPNPVVLTGEYNTYGHGRPTASGNYPGTANPPANYLYDGATDNCYSCHSSAATHAPTAPAADPYRLGAYATDTNGLCDTCHGVGGSATLVDITSHTKTITGSSRDWPGTPDYDYKCVDCHDPHGDLNYAMVRSYLSAPTASTDTSFGSNSYGTPADTAAASAVTFTSTAGYAAGSYGISGTGNGICEVCHTQTSYFQRGIAAAQTHNTSAQCTSCHGHKAGFKAACSGCHATGAQGAPTINASTPHTDYNGATAGGGGDDGCTDCHGGHAASGTAPAGSVYIPTRRNDTGTAVPTMNNQYSSHSYRIRLGGDQTGGFTSEAQICWACHYTQNVSDNAEFGVNQNTATGNLTYDYGTLNSWNATDRGGWYMQDGTTPATWTSGTAGFGYKTAALQSMHGANYAATLPGNDAVGTIRCTYCHDVHNTGAAPAGAPYLRGTWIGNPYREDGAPQSGQNFSSTGTWGKVPRASTGQTVTWGGYWIDQNSSTPQSTWTYAGNASLCSTCHGTTINTLNQFGTTTGGSHTEWVSGYNGHANSVRGATAVASGETSARNIFNRRGGTSGNVQTHDPVQHFQGQTAPGSSGSEGFRAGRTLSYQPVIATCPVRYNTDNWNVDENGSSYQANYHRFPCSKCHTPHASRLPRLMITNCLDTKHNGWDDNYQMSAVGTVNLSRSLSNWTSAQNCHRRGGTMGTRSGERPGLTQGWNNVTPW